MEEIKEKRSDRYKKNKFKIFICILLTIFIIIGCIILWARFISTSGLKVKEIKIVDSNLPNSFYGFKVVHFSDVHYGKTTDKDTLEKLVEKINLIKPDLVLFTGDLIDKDTKITDKVITDITSELSKIESTHGKYAIKGNHDYTSDSFLEIMEYSEFTILENNYDLIYNDINDYIYLGGISSSIQSEVDYDKTLDYFNQEDINKNVFSIMMMHEPDNIDDLVNIQDVSLVLAGHSHGGQVRLPFIGGVGKINGAMKYPDEFYQVKNTKLYVSYGIGTSTYPFRFMNKPSINFYRLYNK